ncbi:DUF1236 domain-containing protein [Acuticoccus kandeliae]|uniref:DUF1236 domain-containing protein n=1 Tax=Acuticoccus kandeliae TaxID=2073160 RepID=UPI000D3E10B7|nr:DUF1236 domain-containing protein [Acuticoccus kandeliae]
MKKLLAMAVGATLIPAAAFAAAGSVTTDLNLRQGPGSNYGVITTIPSGSAVTIDGCISNSTWCQVTYGGSTGFAYSNYLVAAATTGETVVIAQRPSLVGTITAPVEGVGRAAGDVVGSLGMAVGDVVGGVADAISPEPQVVTYVRDHPVDTVYLDGEVVVGASVPEAVVLTDVPSSQYRYAYINSEPVLVDPGNRQIVYVYR